MLVIVLCIIVIFFILVYLSIIWNNDYWEKRGVPYEKPDFFFGSLRDVMNGKKHISILQTELYRKYHNLPYVGFFKMTTPTLLLRDLELIKDVLVKDFTNFSHIDFQVDPVADPIWSANPFSKRDEEWKITRGQWSSTLTLNKVKTMYPTIREKGRVLTNFINHHIENKPNEPLEIKEISTNYLTDVIVSAVFGLEVDSFKNNDNVFRRVTRSVFIATFWDGIKNLLFLVYPWLAKVLKLRFVPKESGDALKKIAKEIMECRNETGTLKNDVYEIMKKYNDLNARNEMSVTELAGRVFGFLLDGTETSSNALSLLLYELALNPNIQTKLRTELDGAYSADGEISHDDLYKLPYLDMVFSESTRLYPAVPTLNRLCSKAYELPPAIPGAPPLKVPVGMPITVTSYALHMDPQYFPDPEKFDPERFSEQNKEKIVKYSYLPFGEGPRICIGPKLALTQIKVAVAEIIRKFELRVVSPESQKIPIIPDPNVFLFRAPEKLLVNFYKRSDHS